MALPFHLHWSKKWPPKEEKKATLTNPPLSHWCPGPLMSCFLCFIFSFWPSLVVWRTIWKNNRLIKRLPEVFIHGQRSDWSKHPRKWWCHDNWQLDRLKWWGEIFYWPTIWLIKTFPRRLLFLNWTGPYKSYWIILWSGCLQRLYI